MCGIQLKQCIKELYCLKIRIVKKKLKIIDLASISRNQEKNNKSNSRDKQRNYKIINETENKHIMEKIDRAKRFSLKNSL